MTVNILCDEGIVFLRLIGAIFSIYFYFPIYACTHYTAGGHCNRKRHSTTAARNARALTFCSLWRRKTHAPRARDSGSGGGGWCVSAMLFRSSYGAVKRGRRHTQLPSCVRRRKKYWKKYCQTKDKFCASNILLPISVKIFYNHEGN